MSTIRDALRAARSALAPISDTPGLEAEVLLCHVTRRDATALLRDDHTSLSPSESVQYDDLVRRRAEGEPIAYLTGEREFWSLRFRVSSQTLIPRPDTETLVERALALIPETGMSRVLDLGTGTGNVAVSIARARPACRITAVDIDESALTVAADNVRSNGVSNVECIKSDWYGALDGRVFDVIVSNPPYVAEGDTHLRTGDVAHEPRRALVSGVDGLDDIRLLVSGASCHLAEGGQLAIEHGADQGQAVRALMVAADFVDVATFPDLGGRERVTGARRPGP